MDRAIREEWGRLRAEWEAARQRLDEHWHGMPDAGPDAQWKADHRSLETLAEDAAGACIEYAVKVMAGQRTMGLNSTRGLDSPDR